MKKRTIKIDGKEYTDEEACEFKGVTRYAIYMRMNRYGLSFEDALLNFKNDDQGSPDYVGLHHIGFWVDDLKKSEKKIEDAGGEYFMGRPTEDTPDTFYEMKFRDPNGIIVDTTHLGWTGSIKEVVKKY